MIISINKKKLLESLLSNDEYIELEIMNIDELKSVFSKATNKEVVTMKKKSKWSLSKNAIDILASPNFENNKLKAYPDEGGKMTIGIGHLLTFKELNTGMIEIGAELVNWKNGITEQQSKTLCIQDMVDYEKAVNNYVNVELTQNQYDSLVFLCFNIGVNGFKDSTVVKMLNSKQYNKVPDAMRMWNKVSKNGVLVVSQGLINRREKEIKIWNGEYGNN